MAGTTKDVLHALTGQGYEVLAGKGGFWIRGEGWISMTAARKRTGIATPKRTTKTPQTASGSYAEFAAIVGRLKG